MSPYPMHKHSHTDTKRDIKHIHMRMHTASYSITYDQQTHNCTGYLHCSHSSSICKIYQGLPESMYIGRGPECYHTSGSLRHLRRKKRKTKENPKPSKREERTEGEDRPKNVSKCKQGCTIIQHGKRQGTLEAE